MLYNNTKVSLLLDTGDCSLVRSQNKRTMNLDHLFAEEITIPNVDVECGDSCFPVHQCNRQKMRVICVTMPESKSDMPFADTYMILISYIF